jgi:predicted DNA-binding transcriptional regulator AlpA
MSLKLISFDQLKPAKGIDYCRDHLRRKWKAGEFPKPVALSDRRIAFREDEIDNWLASRPRRDSTAGTR